MFLVTTNRALARGDRLRPSPLPTAFSKNATRAMRVAYVMAKDGGGLAELGLERETPARRAAHCPGSPASYNI
jgi:hypothetical protein